MISIYLLPDCDTWWHRETIHKGSKRRRDEESKSQREEERKRQREEERKSQRVKETKSQKVPIQLSSNIIRLSLNKH